MHLISGPTTAISVVIFATLSNIHEPGSAAYIQAVLTITLMAGVFQVLMGLVNLGQLVSLVSHSVMVGFTSGAAILIALTQISGFLGQKLPRPENIDAFLNALWRVLPDTYIYVFSIAIGTLASTLACKKFLPKWPNYLVGLLFGGLLAIVIDAREHGVQFVQAVGTSIPPFGAPDLSLESVRSLSSGAIAIALIGLLEAVSVARAISLKSKQSLDSNQEIIGQGLSNIGGSFFSSYLGSGLFTRSELNYESGARTPMAAIFASIFLFVILMVAWKLIYFKGMKHILTTSMSESLVLVVTFLAVLLVNLEFAIYAGVMISLAMFVRRTMRPGLPLNVPNAKVPGRPFMSPILWKLPECPQSLFVRIQGSLYFGSVEFLEKERPDQKHFGLMLDGAVGVDPCGRRAFDRRIKTTASAWRRPLSRGSLSAY